MEVFNMEAIRKFRKNLQRVKITKYEKLENKDKVLKATMTILKVMIYGTLIVTVLPILAGLFIAIKIMGFFSGAVEDAAYKTTDWQGRTYYHKRR